MNFFEARVWWGKKKEGKKKGNMERNKDGRKESGKKEQRYEMNEERKKRKKGVCKEEWTSLKWGRKKKENVNWGRKEAKEKIV